MQRYTVRALDGEAVMDCIICPLDGTKDCSSSACKKRMKQRISAYEDTDLTPERVAELAQADQAGRLVVLPCKVGDTLYAYYNCPTTGICKAVVTDVEVLNGRTVIHTDAFGVLRESDVGENVFLTRQEAEAALERRKKEVAEDG